MIFQTKFCTIKTSKVECLDVDDIESIIQEIYLIQQHWGPGWATASGYSTRACLSNWQRTKDPIAGSIRRRFRLKDGSSTARWCGRAHVPRIGPGWRSYCGVWAVDLGKGSVSARALSRNSGRRLGCLHERVEAGRGLWWGTCGQAQVRKPRCARILAITVGS